MYLTRDADAKPLVPLGTPVELMLSGLRARTGLRTRLKKRIARLRYSHGPGVELVLNGMRSVNRLMCASAPGGRLVELDGVVAGVMPATPEVSLLNNVLYTDPEALSGVLDEIASTYAQAGVDAWTVWVPAADRSTQTLLKRAGHRHVSSPMAMACRLEGLLRPARSALEEWTSSGDPAVMAALCDRVFDLGTAISRAYSGLVAESAHIYVARLDGVPVSSLLTCDRDRNCAVEWVATVPQVRRRGLSTALMRHALADAAARGCTTSTLTATAMGRPGFKRVGYQDLGPLEQWERGGR